jgi:hypothetical protein
MYELVVFHAGSRVASERHQVAKSSEVLAAIPVLLSRHGECERIEVLCAGVKPETGCPSGVEPKKKAAPLARDRLLLLP